METLLCLSIALFAGLMLSRVAKIFKLPAVTAYLIAGILVGPYFLGSFGLDGFGFTSMENIDAYDIIPDVALGFIAFSIGNEFRLSQLKQIGKQATVIGIFQAVVTTALVDAVLIGLHFILGEDKGDVAEGMPMTRRFGHKAWVSIMYGCNNFCTYCIVPYVRGRERSRDPEIILAEARELVAAGYKEITLLGQNVNSYGKGETHGINFAELLRRINAIEGDFTIRFMTSHPKDASHKLIDVMASSKHIAHQFHLPMQSGSDEILAKMNRRYDTEKYLGIVDYMKEKMPDVTITSDIIVGFPGESEEDFEATLAMLERVRFDMLYSFIYSPRKGTPASEMEQVTDSIKSERFERLLEVQNAIALEKNKPLEGQTLRVLCDGRSKNKGEAVTGRTDGGKIVFIDGDECPEGSFVNVKIERAETFALYGKIVD